MIKGIKRRHKARGNRNGFEMLKLKDRLDKLQRMGVYSKAGKTREKREENSDCLINRPNELQ